MTSYFLLASLRHSFPSDHASVIVHSQIKLLILGLRIMFRENVLYKSDQIFFSVQDLIEMLVRLQGTVECQGKKVADLEDYIDSLLIRVMDTAPVLLEKNIIFTKNGKRD